MTTKAQANKEKIDKLETRFVVICYSSPRKLIQVPRVSNTGKSLPLLGLTGQRKKQCYQSPMRAKDTKKSPSDRSSGPRGMQLCQEKRKC